MLLIRAEIFAVNRVELILALSVVLQNILVTFGGIFSLAEFVKKFGGVIGVKLGINCHSNFQTSVACKLLTESFRLDSQDSRRKSFHAVKLKLSVFGLTQRFDDDPRLLGNISDGVFEDIVLRVFDRLALVHQIRILRVKSFDFRRNTLPAETKHDESCQKEK